MVEVDPTTPLVGADGQVPLLDTFEGRTQLFASYHMWHTGRPAADQCEGCTFNTGQVLELSYLHSRDVTFAVFCEGPFDESNRYREFMGWEMPWYSVPETSQRALIAGRPLRDEGVLPARRRPGVRDVLDHRPGRRDDGQLLRMLDMTVYGRQEPWEDSPEGWPRTYVGTYSEQMRTDERGRSVKRPGGRPISHWPRLAAGHSDDLGPTSVTDSADTHPCH